MDLNNIKVELSKVEEKLEYAASRIKRLTRQDNKILSEDLLLKIGNIKKNKLFKNLDSDSSSNDELNVLLKQIDNVEKDVKKMMTKCPGYSTFDSGYYSDYNVRFEYEQAKKAVKSVIKKLREKIHDIFEERRVKELTDEIKNGDIPLDFENAFATDVEANNINCDSAQDGLVYSITNLGRVDIEYISTITGLSLRQVIKDLDGVIYQNPLTWNEIFYKGWETKEQYLIGNLNLKYKDAVNANLKYHGLFQKNVELIEQYSSKIPQVKLENIYFTLGSPWIPANIIEGFINHLLNTRKVEVITNPITSRWKVEFSSWYGSSGYAENVITYGTERMPATRIIEHMLNQTEIAVKQNILVNEDGKEVWKTIRNEEETMPLLEKEKLIREKFQEYIFNNYKRKTELTNIYNDLYCKNFIRHYDGSFLRLDGINENIKLYDYQKNAIARIIFAGNCLLAHDVGSGKTYEMIAAGQELIRMKLSKKNLFVVPNNVLAQWEGMYRKLYPNANIRVIKPKEFNLNNRRKILEDIKNNNYDGIIMAYSSFDMIKASPESKKRMYLQYVDEVNNANEKIETDDWSQNWTRNHAIDRLSIDESRVDSKLKKIGENIKGEIYFDDLNINYLFVDEAHNYKNIPLDVSIAFDGISILGSKKSEEMLAKVRIVHEQNDGKGVIFATGTPITNSLADAYTIQKYLQESTLKFLNINNFRAWLNNYAEKTSEFEVAVDTSSFRLRNRFSKFHNLPELAATLSSVADFYHMDEQEDLPSFKGYDDTMIEQSKELKNIINEISDRADNIRNRNPKKFIRNKETITDNMLLLTVDGRKAALDTRLYDKKYSYSDESKVHYCAENVAKIYFDTAKEKLTQVIFCDISTPKATFNIYDELYRLLVNEYGVKPNEIDYIHNYEKDNEISELFEKVNNGDIRILIGSTFKLGLGVNIQKKLYALHHIDVPWRPADMVQREGRILRPGNTNKEIKIFRYVTKGSFDAYSWQILESKQRFISAILTNNIFERDGDDISDTILKYAEIKALAIGNPKVKERTEKYNHLIKLVSLSKKEKEEKERLRINLKSVKDRLEYLEKEIEKENEDLAFIQSIDFASEEKQTRLDLTKQIFAGITDAFKERKEKEIGEYLGFKIFAPDYQDTLSNKNIYLQRVGRYKLKIQDSEISINRVLINFFKNFAKKLLKLKEEYDEKHIFHIKGLKELEINQSYDKEIEQTKNELDKIDQELGIQ